MDTVFAWAGTHSLERELKPAALAGIAAGDVFIKGGFPGHAVLVADVVENRATGEKRFLLLQSYMPAQDIHVLKNPAGRRLARGTRSPSATASSHPNGPSPTTACAAGRDGSPSCPRTPGIHAASLLTTSNLSPGIDALQPQAGPAGVGGWRRRMGVEPT